MSRTYSNVLLHSRITKCIKTVVLSSLVLSASYTLCGCGAASAGADVASAGTQQQGQGQGQGQKQTNSPSNYPEIKTIVLDILHSKEGMTTLQDTMSSAEFKRNTAITNNDILTAVEKTLQQGQNKSFLAEQMKDTKFAAAIVKASRTQMGEIQKQLMRDPIYQKDLLTLMKAPEFQQTQLELLKSPEYRKEVMKIMTEALQEPTFRLLFMDSMKEAVKAAGGGQASKVSQGQSSGGKSQGSSSSSGSSEKGEGSSDSESGGDGGGGSDGG